MDHHQATGFQGVLMKSTLSVAAAATIAFAAASALPFSAALADHVSASAPQGLQPRPSPFGVSGSSQTLVQVKARLYCYAGTLGALVTGGGKSYILSNNHVLAKENGNLSYGDPAANATIIQPGLLDEGPCTISSGNPANAVADLSDYVPVLFGKGKSKPDNTVDAAIAEVRSNPGALGPDPAMAADGSILGIGTIGGTVTPALGMQVQKTGRTTAHTFGTVQAVDVTVDVSYESGTARFVNQVRIRHVCDAVKYSDSGDSGSLIATVPASGAEPLGVGLLFAGGDVDTFANPLDAALSALNVSMVTAIDGDNPGAMSADFDTTLANCPPVDSGGGGKGGGGGRGGPPFGASGPTGLSTAQSVLAQNSQALLALPDVVGHGISYDGDGNAVIEVYVESRARAPVGRNIPSSLGGVPVRVVQTGPVRPF